MTTYEVLNKVGDTYVTTGLTENPLVTFKKSKSIFKAIKTGKLYKIGTDRCGTPELIPVKL